MAAVGRAFEMPAIAWSRNLRAEDAVAAGVEAVAKDELFARADVLSIHTRLSDRTRGLVGAAELALMRPGAVLINTSRGPIVDEAALLAALADGTLAGAGLDVHDEEPRRIIRCARPRTRSSHEHLGYVSTGTYAVFFRDAVDDVAAYLRGDPVRVLNG